MLPRHALLLVCLTMAATVSVPGQDSAPPGPAAASPLPDAPQPEIPEATVKNTFLHTLQDQPRIFSSPVRIRKHDLVWLLPIAGGTAAAFVNDQRTMQTVVSQDFGFNQSNHHASNGMIGGLIGLPIGLFGVGELSHNPHEREAGLLGGEAMADAVVVEQVIKFVSYRERPTEDDSAGKFFIFKTGANSSFPSAHATVAWASAALLASEYRTPWKQVGVYSLATGVSLTRVLGQQHFPSDVLVGSTLGWLVGHYVYKAHHHTGAVGRRTHSIPTP